VLRIERELEEARSKLAAIRKAKYQEKVGGLAGFTDESDIDIDTGHETSRLDNLLEASAQRISNTTNSINLMRQQNQIHQYGLSQGPSASGMKPSLSPKPGSIDRDRKNCARLQHCFKRIFHQLPTSRFHCHTATTKINAFW